ncbi:MAG: tetratricopeptide (TPR) repeat protein [Chlamydiales bacterium]|jgi:tetratricopeptide (TPR) repeat protein
MGNKRDSIHPFEKTFKENIKTFASKLCEERSPEQRAHESDEVFKRRKEFDLKEGFSGFTNKISEGIDNFKKSHKHKKIAPILKKIDLCQSIDPKFAEEKFLQEILSISENEFLLLYQVAGEGIDTENFAASSSMYMLLCLLNPSISLNWMGLGMSELLQGNISEAKQVYDFALELDKENPSLNLYAAECNLSLGNYDEALIQAENALRISKEDPELVDIAKGIKQEAILKK